MGDEAEELSAALPGYSIRSGLPLDRATVVKFMVRTYTEINPHQPVNHLATTVDRYLSRDTPLWWAAPVDTTAPVAGLWLGQATDQRSGVLHPYVLLLYVVPTHRRRGIATALLAVAHQWAIQQGHQQISLQVFSHNQAAQALYASLGYQAEAVLMKKTWPENEVEV
ncbi:MAG: GNAT family N-acetyltransferase [Nodosilinea sp.]